MYTKVEKGLKIDKVYDIAVVIGTYNRGKYLYRSLVTYRERELDDLDLAIIVIDDGSTDNTEQICQDFDGKGKLDIYYKRLDDKEPGTWRDSACFLNQGIGFAIGKLRVNVVCVTHPEIMIGKILLGSAYNILMNWEDGLACINQKGYYMTYDQQAKIDSVEWYKGVGKIREMDGFYEEGKVGHQGFWHETVDKTEIWQNWIWAAMTSGDWITFGGLGEYSAWGSVDLDFMHRRWVAGVKTITFQDTECYVIHQNHDKPGLNAARDVQDAHKHVVVKENDNGLRSGVIESYIPTKWI